MVEHAKRSLVKALSWRMAGTMATVTISWLITNDASVALSIGVFEFFSKFAIYYLHERAWNKISFGREKAKPPEYNI